MGRTYKYAIIRIVPDAVRNEQFNLGIIIFHSEKVHVELYEKSQLLRALGIKMDSISWLSHFLPSIDDPALTMEERWHNLQNRPGFSLSELSWFSADTPELYKIRLDRIRVDFIDRPNTKKSPSKPPTLIKQLKSEFAKYDLVSSNHNDINNHKIIANVPVGPSGKLQVDFLIKNGVFHATETVDFKAVQDFGTRQLKETALAAVTFDFAREELGPTTTKCYFAFAAPRSIEMLIKPAIQIVENHADEMFNLESLDDKNRYIDLMVDAAGSPRLLN